MFSAAIEQAELTHGQQFHVHAVPTVQHLEPAVDFGWHLFHRERDPAVIAGLEPKRLRRVLRGTQYGGAREQRSKGKPPHCWCTIFPPTTVMVTFVFQMFSAGI